MTNKRRAICAIWDRMRRDPRYPGLYQPYSLCQAELFYNSMRARGWAIVPIKQKKKED